MSVNLIATAEAVDANAFCDETTATDYLQNSRLNVPEWTAASTDDRKRALIWATTIFSSVMQWNGFQTTTTQRLPWPRSAVWKNDVGQWDAHVIPYVLEQATAEMALLLLRKDRSVESALAGLGLSALSIPGPISLTIEPAAVLPLISPYVQNLLRLLGTVVEVGGSSSGSVKLIRS